MTLSNKHMKVGHNNPLYSNKYKTIQYTISHKTHTYN